MRHYDDLLLLERYGTTRRVSRHFTMPSHIILSAHGHATEQRELARAAARYRFFTRLPPG